MKRIKAVAAILLMLAIVFVSMGSLTFRRADRQKDLLFSTDRVIADIRAISGSHHSIMHPEARSDVRMYLYDRLRDMGGKPEILEYDSIPCKFGGTMDIADVYCRFDPLGGEASGTYLLLVAHLDSRFPEVTPRGDTVCSYGAADDGYGLGVVLELVRGALTYAGEWCQGVKVLFTDAEEHELDGIRCALERDNHIFDGVGLAVNVEARGVRGPALLFETSGGNAALMDFYTGYARFPYTYSLTSTVYGMMPNSTDFSYLSPLFPGFNFSVIDNLHYYHTDKDCYENISSKSIAHYGVQLEPMLREYLTSAEYASPDCFRSEEDITVFSVPGLHTFCFTRTGYYLLNAGVLVLFVLTLAVYAAFGRIRFGNVLLNALWILIAGILTAAVATGVMYAAAGIAGVPFSFTALKYMRWDWVPVVVMLVIMAAAYIAFFVSKVRKSENFVFEHLLGLVLLLIVLSAVLLFTVGENFFLLFPALCAVAGLLLHVVLYMNVFSLPALLLAEMACLPFLYNLYVALTAGAAGVVLFLAFLYLIILVSLTRCFVFQRR